MRIDRILHARCFAGKSGLNFRCEAWIFCVFMGFGLACAKAAPQAPAGTSQGHTQARPHRSTSKSKAAEEKRRKAEGLEQPGSKNPSDVAARPAVVTLENRLLTVEANDSDLRQILAKIASLGAMSINGRVNDARVYGVYGPGVPSAVISQLMEGTGYNLIMVGINDEGAPRQLTLTPKTGEATPPSAPGLQAAANPAENSEDENLGPGAIANAPPPPPDDPDLRSQQRLDRLKHMQEQQKEPGQQEQLQPQDQQQPQ